MRNPYTIEGDMLFVHTQQIGNSFTASLEDAPLLEDHRWRVFGTQVGTEMDGVIVMLANYLLNKHKDTIILFRNKEPLDFRRENLKVKGEADSPSTITRGPEVSHLHLNAGINIKIDTDVVKIVDLHAWHATTINGRVNVRTNTGPTRLILHRMLSGAKQGEFVKYRNGDYLDCRRANLQIINKKE